jgi:hypothetical protein
MKNVPGVSCASPKAATFRGLAPNNDRLPTEPDVLIGLLPLHAEEEIGKGRLRALNLRGQQRFFANISIDKQTEVREE